MYKTPPIVALLGFSSATDYPQSYLAIDRNFEKQRLMNRSVNRFFNVGKKLSAKVIILHISSYHSIILLYKRQLFFLSFSLVFARLFYCFSDCWLSNNCLFYLDWFFDWGRELNANCFKL